MTPIGYRVLRFIIRRLLGGLLTLWFVSVFVFAATEVLPGDAATAILGKEASPEALERLRQELDLGEPAILRYVSWLSGVIVLDFGTSLTVGQGRPVASLIATPSANSALLVLAAFFVVVPLSLFVGTASALREGSFVDGVVQIATLVLAAIPEFVMGSVVIILFAFTWPIFPALSFDVSARTLVLPVITLVALSLAWASRMIRAGVVEALRAENVMMARLKGLPEKIVIRRHVLPNAMGPSLQALALVIGFLASGVVVVEFLFAFPGIGQGLVTGVRTRDIPVVQAYTLIIASVYIMANLGADLLAILLNPRLRSRL